MDNFATTALMVIGTPIAMTALLFLLAWLEKPLTATTQTVVQPVRGVPVSVAHRADPSPEALAVA